MSEIPPYLSTGLVARACRMRTEKARRMLVRAGILERLGGSWVVSDSRLRDRLPDVYDRVFSHIALQQAETSKETHGHAKTRA